MKAQRRILESRGMDLDMSMDPGSVASIGPKPVAIADTDGVKARTASAASANAPAGETLLEVAPPPERRGAQGGPDAHGGGRKEGLTHRRFE